MIATIRELNQLVGNNVIEKPIVSIYINNKLKKLMKKDNHL